MSDWRAYPSTPSGAELALKRSGRREGYRATLAWVVRKPGLVFGATLLLIFALIALAAPQIAPPSGENPYVIPRDGYQALPRPPSPDHPLGTLAGQYDVFYGLVWGTRSAFSIGLTITLGRALIGVTLGILAGSMGGLLDAILMRLTDAFMAFPSVAIAMVMLALFGLPLWELDAGQRQDQIIILALVLFGWMPYARLIRGNVLAERHKDYIQAARAVGVPRRRIIIRHLLPNSTQGLFVLIASDIGGMMVLVAAFSFIGLRSLQAAGMRADWGEMLAASRDWVISVRSNPLGYWFTYAPASLLIVLFATAWSLIGDNLRDLLDPYRRS